MDKFWNKTLKYRYFKNCRKLFFFREYCRKERQKLKTIEKLHKILKNCRNPLKNQPQIQNDSQNRQPAPNYPRSIIKFSKKFIKKSGKSRNSKLITEETVTISKCHAKSSESKPFHFLSFTRERREKWSWKLCLRSERASRRPKWLGSAIATLEKKSSKTKRRKVLFLLRVC